MVPASVQNPRSHLVGGIVLGLDDLDSARVHRLGQVVIEVELAVAPGLRREICDVGLGHCAKLAKVGMVVSLGHCSCNPTGPGMMPGGSMSMLDADTNTWLAVPYVRERTSTDVLAKTLVEPFVLEQGQTITLHERASREPPGGLGSEDVAFLPVVRRGERESAPIGAVREFRVIAPA